MKLLIALMIMSVFTSTAMPPYAAQAATTIYLADASYFKVHRLRSCEVHRGGTYYVDFQCKEHSDMQEDLKQCTAVVVFYTREDLPVGLRQCHHGHIGDQACQQAKDKLDPKAKPIAVRAELYEEPWKGNYLRFFDAQGKALLKLLYYHDYFEGNTLGEVDTLRALEHVELDKNFLVKDKREKSGCCVLI